MQAALGDPPDWDDLSLYGFYCLEAAVEAAAIHAGLPLSTRHWEKASMAATLHSQHELPDVSELLRDLNQARKATAYGDVPHPDLDPERVALGIGQFVDAVSAFLEREP